MLRIPKRPPPLDELINEASRKGRLSAILEAQPSLKTKDYLHWDKLRHLKPPLDLNHREWWTLLKLHRTYGTKSVPLRDVHNCPFGYATADPVLKLAHMIDRRGGEFISDSEPITNPDMKDRYWVHSLIEEATTSSILEGAATTREAAREMIRSGRRPRNRSEHMVLNNFKTMQRIGEFRKEPLSTELVLEIHRSVTRDTLDDASMAGRFRLAEQNIEVGDDYGQVFHVPPPAEQLEQRMQAMCAFANDESAQDFMHPVVRAIILHFWLAYDHPFVDGNGRTARALFYWSMLHRGYWLFEFISISEIILKGPSKYGRAFLHTETDDNDLTYFILHQVEVIRRAFDQLHAYVERKTTEFAQLEQRLKNLRHLNHRQQALVGHALRHAHHDYTIEGHQRSHGVVYQTARTDLLSLAEKGLFESFKVGREWHFRPAPRLEERLVDDPPQ